MRNLDTNKPFLLRHCLVALAIGPWLAAQATTYYVSPTGNDSNNGTSPSTPWQTINRVNQMTYQVQPGDQILFQRGGRYSGEVIWGVSGTASAPVVIGAYGSGAKPIIDGAEQVTGWSQHSGNVWKAHVGQLVEQVFVNGQRMTLGRMPDAGWFRNDQASGNTLQSSDLNQGNGFWNGARCVVRCTASSIDTLRVTGFNNGTLTFSTSPSNSNMGADDWGFFMENRLDLVNAPNEWFYNAGDGYLYLQAPGNANPNNLTVEASVHFSGVNCYWMREHLRVEHIAFTRQRNAGIRLDDAHYVTMDACEASLSFHGIRSYGHHNTFTNNFIHHTTATAALLIDNNTLFQNNVVEDIALIPGAGEHSWGYFGVRAIGQSNTIRGNRFNNIGYTAIECGQNQLVERNVIEHHLATMNDGAAIAFDNTDGLTIQDNIIHDAVCGLDGSSTVMPHFQRLGLGIYFGNTSNKNVIVRRNTIANLTGVGINVDHNMNAVGHQIKDNTIFNCAIGMSISDYSNSNGPHAVAPYFVPNFNDQYDGNIIYGLSKDQIAIRFFNCYSPQYTDFGTFTNNRYFNPYNEMAIFHFSFQAGQWYYSVEEWQAERNEESGTTSGSLHLSGHGTTAELTGDILPGGDFSSNVTGWGGWPTNAQVTHNTNNLDNGCLKAYLPNASVYETFGLRNPDWFDLQAGQWYRLRFSTVSDAPGQIRAAIKGISQENNPYFLYDRLVPFSTQRRDHEIYFQAPTTEQARIMLINRYTEPMYYLDNVTLHKVQVQELDPLDNQIVLINEEATAQTFALTGCWSDVDGMMHSDEITVPAFGSVVLVKEQDDACATSTPLGEDLVIAAQSNVYPNPVSAGATLNFASPRSGAAWILDAKGAVVANLIMAPGSRGVELPAHLVPGVHALRMADGTTDRLIIE